ncbi:uncharacterized protein LOC144552007 isoform X3 [Carex rostrata]
MFVRSPAILREKNESKFFESTELLLEISTQELKFVVFFESTELLLEISTQELKFVVRVRCSSRPSYQILRRVLQCSGWFKKKPNSRCQQGEMMNWIKDSVD